MFEKNPNTIDITLSCSLAILARSQGGVKILSTAEEVEGFAKQMFGDNLVTKQTSEDGQTVNMVLVNKGINITDEVRAHSKRRATSHVPAPSLTIIFFLQ